MAAPLHWGIDGRDWPNRAASRFVESDGLRWHVQIMGEGPALLLLHGTGAATHSWRALAPMLARTHTIIAPDLPGHGFTTAPPRGALYTLPAVALALRALMRTLEAAPAVIVGHSAGAAIGVRMALDGVAAHVVSLNGALTPWPGPLGALAPLMAQALLNPLTLTMFAQRAAAPGAVVRLMRSTGSELDDVGLDLYALLLRNTHHLRATINLMAHWDLAALSRDLPALTTPLTLIVADDDRAVPPRTADAVRALVPHARRLRFPEAGHLAHEEAPDLAADLIARALAL